MNNNKVQVLSGRLEREFLPRVRRPGRYIGGEINQVKKDLDKCEVKVALCFPDVYEIAMSNTALAIIYETLNRIEGVAAERVFCPWIDAERIMRDSKIPLFTLESTAAAGDFDIIGFSLNNELCYTNMLTMLDLAGLAVRSADRGEDDPLIIAGGQVSNSCEPVAAFVDMFVLGDGEEAIVELVELFVRHRRSGTSKKDFLREAAERFGFVYVPSLYEFEYEGDTIIKPRLPHLPVRFENAVVKDMDSSPVPSAPIVPFVKAVHERISVEIMRGCPGRCRFCQAGFCRRPIRCRSVERIVEIAKANHHATGFDTVSLLSLSTADYPILRASSCRHLPAESQGQTATAAAAGNGLFRTQERLDHRGGGGRRKAPQGHKQAHQQCRSLCRRAGGI